LKSLKFTDEFIALWGTGKEAEKKIVQAAIIETFREGQISSGKAAELLGMTRQDFLDFLASKKVPVGTHPLEDSEAARRIAGKKLTKLLQGLNLPDVPEAKVERDVKKAISAIRGKK
jgi:predicted HTH domain antitoxin